MSRRDTTASNASSSLGPVPPGKGLKRGFTALRHRNYRLFWCGQLVSVTGTWMQTLAQSWLVITTLGGSAFALSLVNILQFTPILFLGLVGGVIADRFPKRNLLVATQSTAAVLAATLAILTATNEVQLWHVYALAFGLGLANAVDMPTRQAIVSELVGKDDVMNAVALNSALFNSGRIVGPAVAGVLLAAFGPAICFGLNSASYLAVIAGLLLMRIKPTAVTITGSGLTRLREGLAYVRATPEILRPIILVGFVATFGMNFNIWVPLLARENFTAGATGFGLLMSSMGAGSLVGALTLAFIGRGPRRALMVGAAVALGSLELLLGLAGAIPMHVAAGMVLLTGIGFSMSMTMATANTTVQTTAADELRGRVMSVYMTVFAGTVPFGALVAGAIANWFGAPASVAVCGLITLVAAVTIGGWRLGSGLRVADLKFRALVRRSQNLKPETKNPSPITHHPSPTAHGED